MTGSPKSLIVLVGPTAVGKTAIAIRLALKYRTEIISADSRQIYRELTIGTAKPSGQELGMVRHHFIDTHSITETYNAARYGEEALKKINDLFEIHAQLILCGGSGLYVKAVCEGFDEIPEIPRTVRDKLNEEFEKNGIGWLQEQMKELDPVYYEKIDRQNPQRMIRALEVKIGTGASIDSFQKNKLSSRPFKIIKVGLTMDRKFLYERINKRMDAMIASGLFEEARQVYSYKDHNALQTVGYQEIFDYFDGKYGRDEAVRLLKQNSRRYAKRQLTWFTRDKTIKWFDPNNFDEIVQWLNAELA